MLTDLVLEALANFPEFATFLTIIGFLRVINKPLFALILATVKATDTDVDDKWWAKVQKGKGMKTFFWLLDFTASVKLPKADK